jgi:hypothetical protein
MPRPTLASLLEDFRNWNKTQDWMLNKQRDIYGNEDPDTIALNEKLAGIGTADMGMLGSSVGGLAGMLIGEAGAKRAGYGSLIDTAKELYKKGINPEEIFQRTKTFLGPDNKWMHEISDVGANLTVNDKGINFYHPELEKAYPEYVRLKANFKELSNPKAEAQFSAPDPLLQKFGAQGSVNFNKGVKPSLSTMLHEVQHWIQNKPENQWEPGANLSLYDPAAVMQDINKVPSNVAFPKALEEEANAYGLLKNQQLYSPMEMYKRNFGEAMARNTQKRMYLSPEELANNYWVNTVDVPLNEMTTTQMPLFGIGRPRTRLLDWPLVK